MSSFNSAISTGNLAASQALTTTPAVKTDSPAKIKDAAQQFESLLIAQILHTAHESGSGWLGSGSDSSSDSLGDFAEQQLAAVMAKNGGLGLAKMIAEGLERKNNSYEPPASGESK
jgi:Rod binding domain-containing protein